MEAHAEPAVRHGARQRLGAWIDERFGISGLAYPVPEHANGLAFTLGGITAGTFLLLVVTGVYLAQFYDPTVDAAHTSVTYIIDEAPLGRLVRSVHVWLSTIFVVTLTLHLLRTFVTASFKRPREGTWLVGVLLFVSGAGLLFTGTILKWDQEAVEALEHNGELAKLFGLAGVWFTNEFADNVSLLTRSYIAHVSILPLAVVALVGVHVLLVKRLRVSPLPWGSAAEVERRERDEHRVPFTSHLARIGLWTGMALALALLLSAIWPAGLGPAGVGGIEITKPPWYFLWLYPLENWFGLNSLAVFPAVLIVGLLAVPWLDRSLERDPRRRKLWLTVTVLVLAAWAALTIFAWQTAIVEHIGM